MSGDPFVSERRSRSEDSHDRVQRADDTRPLDAPARRGDVDERDAAELDQDDDDMLGDYSQRVSASAEDQALEEGGGAKGLERWRDGDEGAGEVPSA